jgi:hypothetical protein
MAVQQYPAGAAGGTSNLTQAQVAATTPSYTLQHTITSSTNNFATNAGQVFVYAVVVGGGGMPGGSQGGSSARVVFGMTPVRAVVKIGASLGTTVFGNLQAGGGFQGQIQSGNLSVSPNGFPTPGDYSRSAESGLMGGGGNNGGTGGNSTYGFNGGTPGTVNGSGNTFGGGGGAGILANGANGGNATTNTAGAGGAGGAGGGGGGTGGTNNNFCGTNYGTQGAGGAGVVLVYY